MRNIITKIKSPFREVCTLNDFSFMSVKFGKLVKTVNFATFHGL